MDKIILRGVPIESRVGVSDAERQRLQMLVIDLDIEIDLAPAGSSDNVKDTVDYSKVVAALQSLAMESSFRLIEALAEHLARRVFLFPGVAGVWLRLTKPAALAYRGVESTAVEIHRSRGSNG